MTIESIVGKSHAPRLKSFLAASALALAGYTGMVTTAHAAMPNFPTPENVVSVNSGDEERAPELNGKILYFQGGLSQFGKYTILRAFDDGSGGFTNVRTVAGVNIDDYQQSPALSIDSDEMIFSRYVNSPRDALLYTSSRINPGSPYTSGDWLDNTNGNLNMISAQETSPSIFGIGPREDLSFAFVRYCDPSIGCTADPNVVNGAYETRRADTNPSTRFEPEIKMTEFDNYAAANGLGRVTSITVARDGLTTLVSFETPTMGEDLYWAERLAMDDGSGNRVEFTGITPATRLNTQYHERNASFVEVGGQIVGVYFESDRPDPQGDTDLDIWRSITGCSAGVPPEVSAPTSPYQLLVTKDTVSREAVISFEALGDDCGTLNNLYVGRIPMSSFDNIIYRWCRAPAEQHPIDLGRFILRVPMIPGSESYIITASSRAAEGPDGMANPLRNTCGPLQ